MMIRSRTSLSGMSLQGIGAVPGHQSIQRIGSLETSPGCRHDGGLRRYRGYLIVSSGTVLACLLAFATGVAHGASGVKRASFSVTLEATVTKEWNTLGQAMQRGCPVSIRAIGRRTTRLRSTRPTTVVATFADGRVSYSPAAVRFVA